MKRRGLGHHNLRVWSYSTSIRARGYRAVAGDRPRPLDGVSMSTVVRASHALGPRLVISLVHVCVAVSFPREFEKNDRFPLRTSLFSRGVKLIPSVGPSVASTTGREWRYSYFPPYGGTEFYVSVTVHVSLPRVEEK